MKKILLLAILLINCFYCKVINGACRKKHNIRKEEISLNHEPTWQLRKQYAVKVIRSFIPAE